jgi:hypothetical protein
MHVRSWTAVLALLGSLIASPALALEGGGAFVLGAPHGALGEQADFAAGVGGHLLQSTKSGKAGSAPGRERALYGSETLRIPVAGTAGRLNREITTENWVAQVGLGRRSCCPCAARVRTSTASPASPT